MTGPTRITDKGSLIWEDSDGLYHREDGPAIIYPNGTERWFYHGQYHRTDGPAITTEDGTIAWFLHNRVRTLQQFVESTFPEDTPERTAFILKWAK